MTAAIFDLDQTLIDSSALASLRQARQWSQVMNSLDRILAYQHIDSYLVTLQRCGIPYAIVTNSPRMYCEAVVQHFDWHPQAIVAWHCTKQHRPHPAPIQKALTDMGINASHNVYGFGDDVNDIHAYAAACIRPVGCTWGASQPGLLKDTVESHRGLLVHTLDATKLRSTSNIDI